MTDTVKTFNWTSNADSFSFTPTGSPDETGAWQATGGDADAGCIYVDVVGRNKVGAGTWSRTITFEDMGVPAGSTVSGITSASIKTKCDTYVVGSGNACTCGPATLTDGSTPVTLASSRTVTAADGTYQTQSGVNNTSLSWASSQSVTINITHNTDVGNDGAANIKLLFDTLTFTITYAASNYQETLSQSVTSSAAMLEAVNWTDSLAQAVTSSAAMVETLGTPYNETLSASVTSSAKVRDVTGQGDMFTVVYTSDKAQPSAAQIFKGLDATGGAAVFVDQKPATSTGAYTFSATGLTPETSYQAAFVGIEGTTFSNVVETGAFVTLADTQYQETLAQAVTSSASMAEAYTVNYSETLAQAVTSTATTAELWQATDTISQAVTSSASMAESYQFGANYQETISQAVTSSAAMAEAIAYSETLSQAVTSSAATAETYDAPDYSETLSETVTSSASTAESYEFGNNYQETVSQSVTSSAAMVEVYTAPDYAETLAAAVASSALMAESYDAPTYSETLSQSVTSSASTAEQFGYLGLLSESVTSSAAMVETYDAPDYSESISAQAAATASFSEQFSTPNVLPSLVGLSAISIPGYSAIEVPGYTAKSARTP